MKFTTTEDGFFTVKKGTPKGTKCGYCPKLIFKELEAGGVIHKCEGLPICAKCRIMKGKFGEQIKLDAVVEQKHINSAKKRREIEEAERIKEIAYQTQVATKTKISK